LVGFSILHDNALVGFLDSSVSGWLDRKISDDEAERLDSDAFRGHCRVGEEKVRMLPFLTQQKNVVLYHHERADGNGAFRIRGEDTPLMAQIVHMADSIDVLFHSGQAQDTDWEKIRAHVHDEAGKAYTERVVQLFDQTFSSACVKEMETRGVDACLREDVPDRFRDFSRQDINGITRFFAGIVDYKSSFTRNHSMGVARRAEVMARHYGWSEDKIERYYFAGALHDIGKLVISNDILEKPGRLTGDEFEVMQNHASQTYHVLHQVKGIEDITEWAANHHEKLDGSGYPRGLKAEQLSFEDRLMACIDIYQALTEERPYKKGLSHEKTMSIMRDMVCQGKIDPEITEEMGKVFGAEAASSQKNGDDATETSDAAVKRWRCPICGYVYEGENPPAVCPVCDMPGVDYELIAG
ncbi:MAG: HD domain-containing phosphohydrolase, partial [Bilifractor sp.]